MFYYAELDQKGIVVNVISSETDLKSSNDSPVSDDFLVEITQEQYESQSVIGYWFDWENQTLYTTVPFRAAAENSTDQINYRRTDTCLSDMLDGFSKSNHTHSTNVIVQQTQSPSVKLTLTDSKLETRVYKNASTTTDYGTFIADYDSNGDRDALVITRNKNLEYKLMFSVTNGDKQDVYYLYGEHHKPTAAEVGALPATGDVDVDGVLRVEGKQAIYNNGTRMTFGSGDLETYATGTKLYCNQAWSVASDATLKENVVSMQTNPCVDFINSLQVKTYNYIGELDVCMGVIAQDVEKHALAKYFVREGADGKLAVKVADLVFPLIVTVQQLSERVTMLERK